MGSEPTVSHNVSLKRLKLDVFCAGFRGVLAYQWRNLMLQVQI
jgi:hypothetical protein